MRPKRLCESDGCGKKHYARGMCVNHYHYWFNRNRGGELGPRQDTGRKGEIRTMQMFREYGRSVVAAPYASPYDCTVDGWRVDVKTARFNMGRGWQIRFHSHGVLKEKEKDFYVARLENIPNYRKHALYLAFESPAGKLLENICLMSLIAGRYVKNYRLFRQLLSGALGVKTKLEAVDAA